MPYISVCKWRDFQHYKDRWPPWIKNTTDLMANERYLDLSGHRRAILHGLWLEYTTSRCELKMDTRRLSYRLYLKVTTADVQALVDAGFLAIVASAEKAEGYNEARRQKALAYSQEAEAEAETEKALPQRQKRTEIRGNGLPVEKERLVLNLIAAIRKPLEEEEADSLRKYASVLPESALVKAIESVKRKNAADPLKYAFGVLISEKRELAERSTANG